MRKKAIIFDLDGTAVDSPIHNLPSERLVRAVVALQKDYWMCAATGRGWSCGKDVLRALRLKDPCVIAAGTQICNPQTGEILWQKNMDAADAKRVIEIFREYPESHMLCNDYSLDDYLSKNFRVKDYVFPETVFFLELIDLPENVVQVIAEKIRKIEGLACIAPIGQHNSAHRDIHVINVDATKEQAIAEILKMMGVERNNTVGIGDGGNDIHLFNAVGKRVAIGNAIEKLKGLADLVIRSVQDDGLAEYFESLS
ncbi:hypothetical protein COT87_02235 [Candidatus Collierbacteria bacterium CG10_big_fil_rev_8_21_14_0_10_44_9]|uniref:Cof-type HAD-IIB family hydrolase n=1 Tax=Candidatus Collierbacteria bacterium CG10_big_fil_rev_8_21_14_0_10_44_9 TaxID=1974535 RepID=A0A2H0VIM4_9BACT|nr:MAG: hypothetical protein COT87_02235 [Candidatus Collierbacteria bacterium CG10_big_fil_rev_8_21_14_0_10_44_9]